MLFELIGMVLKWKNLLGGVNLRVWWWSLLIGEGKWNFVLNGGLLGGIIGMGSGKSLVLLLLVWRLWMKDED